MQTFFENLLSMAWQALPHILWALLAFFVGLAIANWLSRFVLRALSRSKVDPTVHAFLAACVKAFVLVIAIITAASFLGIPTASIITLLGGAAVGIGLALKDNLSNFASGMILLFTRPFKVGDYIETDQGKGYVERIDMMFTSLVTPDNQNVLLPNSQLIGGRVTNYSVYDTRRISVTLVVPFETDLSKALSALSDMLANEPKVLKNPVATVGAEAFCDRGVQINILAWGNREEYWDILYLLHRRTHECLTKAGIPFALPHIQMENKEKKTDPDI
ncbi:MAG: mechanosensitive ion channel family protein [Christensenellales bacterium]